MARTTPKDQTRSNTDWWVDRAAACAIGLGRALPVDGQRILAHRLAAQGFSKQKNRAVEQLQMIWPDMPLAEAEDCARGSVETMLRGTFEIADSRRLLARSQDNGWTLSGDGLAALAEAKAAGQPVILATGHFGNWEAARAALTRQGYEIGGLYRPLNNGYLDDRWAAILAGLSGPVFPRGRQGLRGMLKYLRSGGMLVILPDQFFAGGALLDFLGHPAPTSLAAAEMALRFDAPLVPFYGTRDGTGFSISVEAPIPPSTPEIMMQAVNDSLATKVREHTDQWLWPHRRWKPARVEAMERARAVSADAQPPE